MNMPQHVGDFPADARWVQTAGGAVVVCKDGRVFRIADGKTVELLAQERTP